MVTGLGTVNQNPQQIGFSQQNEQQKRSSDNRRSNKPIMEKRRRARINNSLNELKTLILDAMKKDPARHSKLEKADILEMAVKYLQNLQRQQVAMTTAADPNVLNKFRAGFNECATEVGKFPGLDPAFRRRLLQHLATCLSGSTTKQETSPTTQVQVHILPSPPSSPEQSSPNSSSNSQLSAAQNGIYFTNGSGNGYQLVPTRLPNGDIALVLPTTNASSQYRQPETQSPLPMLIPIPSRTASTASASSSSSSNSGYERLSVNSRNSPSVSPYCAPLSPPSSHQGYDMDVHRIHSPPLQAPLSLVMKKKKSYEIAAEQEKPWRPW